MVFFNIKMKLFLVLIAVSLLPIVVVSISSYNSYTKLVNKQTALVASTTINNSVKSIENTLRNIDRISITLQQQSSSPTSYSAVGDELKKLVATDDPYEIFVIRNKMKLILENILLGYDYINGIYLFAPDGKSISFEKNGTDLKLGYIPFKDDWYNQTIQNKGNLYIGDIGVKPFLINAKPSISFSRALYDINTREFLGVFMLDCSTEIFKELNKDIAPNIFSIYLANGSGKIIYDGSGQQIGQDLPQELLHKVKAMTEKKQEFNNGDTLSIIQSFPSNNWKLIATISVKELYREYGISQKLIIYISITCAVIFLLLSFFLSNWITKPIIQLSKIMRKNKSRKFVTTETKLKRVDEIGILYNEYDKMMQDMDTFVRERYQNRILTLDSQMKALEAQINSHFLYNTLESINSIAEIEEVESIAVMTKSLGDMFRYSIKTESELVRTEEELQHVDNYMAIQLIRYEDKINYYKEIDEQILTGKILKLLLQPLVENALYHGLENKKGKGSITIKGYSIQDSVCFEIIDDGVGMSAVQVLELQKLLNQPPEFSGLGHRSKQSIGLKNVHSRIALYYGPEYGLTFESGQNTGTKVKLTLPLKF